MEKNYCSHCGSELQENVKFCPKCGTPISGEIEQQDTVEEAPKRNRKSLYALLAVIGAIILIICGAVYYSDSQERRVARLAREKFVADSLESVRQDSLKMAKQKEKEEQEAKKLAEFRKKLSLNNILALLKTPQNGTLAQNCGLSFLYKDTETEDSGDNLCFTEMVYGRDIEKGEKKDDLGYVISPTSEHACYFLLIDGGDRNMEFCFKSKDDIDYLFGNVKDYGLIKYGESYYIPKNKSAKGIKYVDEYDPYENASFCMSNPILSDGWYKVSFYQCSE